MEETEEEFEKRIRKEIDDYWDSYREGIRKFDHQALYISSGALAFSLTFVKEICPFDKSCDKSLTNFSLFFVDK